MRITLYVNFNESLTNDVVSFEQLGPGYFFFFFYYFFSSLFWTIVDHKSIMIQIDSFLFSFLTTCILEVGKSMFLKNEYPISAGTMKILSDHQSQEVKND